MTELAIDGGPRVRQTPLPSWPHYSDTEIDAVTAVLRSGKGNSWVGEEVRRFEQAFAEKCGVRYAVALANGTLALELALRVLDIGQGDEVIVPCRTFIATASAVVITGATPVMADVDRDSQNITSETIAPLITSRTKAIIAVHLAGWPCDMDSIMALSARHGLKVIEDCAQAHGARFRGRSVGSLGDLAAFSFCQDKIMSTGGEGGMLLTNDEELWRRAWEFKDHGKSFDAVFHREHPPGYGFRWLHESFGTNWRLTEMQAAIGLNQLDLLEEWCAKRHSYATTLNACLSSFDAVRLTIPPQDVEHAYYKHYAFIRPDRLREGWSRDRVITAINAEGIPCMEGSCPEIYREKAFVSSGLAPAERLPVAKELCETGLMFLVHPTLSPEDIVDTCEAIIKVFTAASR